MVVLKRELHISLYATLVLKTYYLRGGYYGKTSK